MERTSSFFVIGLCTVILPGVHGLRKVFSYCGRPTRKISDRRNTSHHTMTSVFDQSRKSRKASDSGSHCTNTQLSVADHYEMDTATF